MPNTKELNDAAIAKIYALWDKISADLNTRYGQIFTSYHPEAIATLVQAAVLAQAVEGMKS